MTSARDSSPVARAARRLRHVPTARAVTIAAVALIVVQLTIRTIFVSRSWFLVDDFLFLSDIARGIDDFGWYTRIHQGHFMPISFVLVKIGSLFGPWSWAAAATEIIALQALASVACWLMLRVVFGNRPAILLGLGFYLFSPLTMPTIMWWAVAINQLPHQIACFGAIAAHVVFLRTRRWRPALVATAFLVLGYGTYTKTLLLPVVLVVVTMSYFASGPLPRRTWDSLRLYWRAWVLYGVLTVAFVIVYVRSAPATIPGRRTSLAELGETSVLETFGSTVVGGPWRWSLFGGGPISYSAAPQLGIVLAWFLIVGLVVWAWARNERVLRLLWVPALYLAASIALVFVGRAYVLSILGSGQVGRHVQYLSDASPVLTLTLVGLIVPIVGATEAATRRSPGHIDVRLDRRLVRGLLVALGVALLAGSVVTSARYAQPWSRQFNERAFTVAAERTIRAHDPLLADVNVPPEALSPLFGERALIRSYFAPMGDAVRTSRAGNDLEVLDASGSAVPADVDATDRSGADQSRRCPIRVEGRARTIRIVPVLDIPLWMAVDYRADSSGVVSITLGAERRHVPVEAGAHTLFVATDSAYATVTVRPLVDQRICISSIRVGPVVVRNRT